MVINIFGGLESTECEHLLMNITFASGKGKIIFENKIGNHYPENYGEIKKVLSKYEVTTAFYIENINETCLDVPDGWIIIDA